MGSNPVIPMLTDPLSHQVTMKQHRPSYRFMRLKVIDYSVLFCGLWSMVYGALIMKQQKPLCRDVCYFPLQGFFLYSLLLLFPLGIFPLQLADTDCIQGWANLTEDRP
jgi:hypothetical protein